MQTQTTPTPRRGARIALVVAGAIAALLAFGALSAGGVALWADDRKDGHGFVSTDRHQLSSGASALVSENIDLELNDADWLVDEDQFGDVRLEVEGAGSEPVFVGIARTDAVRAYLRDVAHSTVLDPDRLEHHAGDRRPVPPANAAIWAASSSGTGEQALTWEVEDGDWSVVVMNADGSKGVDAHVAAGAKLPWLDDLGWALLGTGGGLASLAALLTVLAFRGGRPSGSAGSGTAPRPAQAPAVA